MIDGFRTGTDGIDLIGYAPGAAAHAIATQRTYSGGTLLKLSDGTKIELAGVAHATQGVFV